MDATPQDDDGVDDEHETNFNDAPNKHLMSTKELAVFNQMIKYIHDRTEYSDEECEEKKQNRNNRQSDPSIIEERSPTDAAASSSSSSPSPSLPTSGVKIVHSGITRRVYDVRYRLPALQRLIERWDRRAYRCNKSHQRAHVRVRGILVATDVTVARGDNLITNHRGMFVPSILQEMVRAHPSSQHPGVNGFVGSTWDVRDLAGAAARLEQFAMVNSEAIAKTKEKERKADIKADIKVTRIGRDEI